MKNRRCYNRYRRAEGMCAHMHLTMPKAFVRFVANSMHQTDYTRLDAWIERIIKLD